MFRLGAFAVIFDAEGAVLLCRRADMDVWNLPGGGVEQGETPWDAAIRETREEVGLDVAIERLAGVYAKPDQTEVVFSFICRVVGGELSTSVEAVEVRYVQPDDLPPNTVPKQVERIRDAVTGGGQPILRRQIGPGTRQLIEQGIWPARAARDQGR